MIDFRRLFVAVFACVLLLGGSAQGADPPPLGITSTAVIDRVVDGDTVDVEVTIGVRVRLLDCWAPEIRGDEEAEGRKSKAALERLLPAGSEAVVHIPTNSPDLASVLTFGRVLAHIWPAGCDRSVSETMVQQGYATREKPE